MRTRWTSPIAGLIVLLFAFGAMAPAVSAQDASPEASPIGSPVASPTGGTGETITSISRDAYYQQLREAFDFEEPESEGGQLIQGELSDIQTTNALLVDDVYSGWINGLIYESLVGTSPVDGSIVPGLADRYELAPDGVTYTFELNQDATWHDGTDLTAADVVFSFDYAVSEEGIYAYRSDVAGSVESYRAVDDDTVEIVSTEPLASFLYDVPGTVFVLPMHVWEDIPFDSWQNDPGSTGQDPSRVVGTGPFRFQEWAQGDQVTLVRNDDYWDPEAVPVLDEYVYRVLPDENTLVQALTTGEIDVFEQIPAAQVEDVENAELTAVRNYPTLGFNWYSPNHELVIFQEVPVRQAMLHALDRQLIAEEIYVGFAEQANGTQPVLSPAYAPDRIENVYDYSPERATALLEEAGWTDSDEDGAVDKDVNADGSISAEEQLRFDFIYTEGVAIYEQMVPYMQEAWAEVGIDMLPQAVPFPTLSQRVDDGDYGVALYGFNWSPDGGQGLMFRCDAFSPDGFNAMRYCNPAYDELDDRMNRTLDPEARIELQVELANLVNNDAPNGVIVFRERNSGYNTRVHNFFPTGFGFIYTMQFVWTDPQ